MNKLLYLKISKNIYFLIGNLVQWENDHMKKIKIHMKLFIQK